MSLEWEGVCPLLTVFDMPESIAFYRDLLGFEVVATAQPGNDFDWALLRHDGADLMLNTAYERHERPAARDPGRIAAHLDTALFFGCRDVDAAYSYLRARGLDVQPPAIRDYGMKQLYFTDPDGYNLCFQWSVA